MIDDYDQDNAQDSTFNVQDNDNDLIQEQCFDVNKKIYVNVYDMVQWQ